MSSLSDIYLEPKADKGLTSTEANNKKKELYDSLYEAIEDQFKKQK